VLAERLSRDGAASVLLIEAGGWDRDPWIRIPIGWGRIMQRRLHDWGYDTEPEPWIGGRTMECMRGKVIGGSSSINAMAYVRGNKGDYERWAGYGLPDFTYAKVLPYFRKQECWEGGEDAYRGASGPLHVSRARYPDPLAQDCLEAAETAGLPSTPDYNGATQEGFSVLQSTIGHGRRCSAADAFLRPALGRRNLKIVTHALVKEVVFEGDRAVAVDALHGREIKRFSASSEIVLAAGAMNTPQLLMLSGIGAPDELSRVGIPTRVALPGVGRNLQDHSTVAVEFERRTPGPFVRNMRADRIVRSLAEGYFLGRGFATDLPSGWTAFLRTPSAAALPDIQLIFRAVPLTASPWFPGMRAPFQDGFAVRAVLLRPQSRGTVRLRSADPADKVAIRQNLLAAEADRKTIAEGLEIIRGLAAEPAMRAHIGRETGPGPGNWAKDALGDYIGRAAATAHHPAGTCRMGGGDDPLLVLDPEFRVRGVRGLRVADASAFPDLVGGNINAAVMMLAEKAAETIRVGRASEPAGSPRPARETAEAGEGSLSGKRPEGMNERSMNGFAGGREMDRR
jgi:choline dehydrogenase-like flavoprotein